MEIQLFTRLKTGWVTTSIIVPVVGPDRTDLELTVTTTGIPPDVGDANPRRGQPEGLRLTLGVLEPNPGSIGGCM